MLLAKLSGAGSFRCVCTWQTTVELLANFILGSRQLCFSQTLRLTETGHIPCEITMEVKQQTTKLINAVVIFSQIVNKLHKWHLIHLRLHFGTSHKIKYPSREIDFFEEEKTPRSRWVARIKGGGGSSGSISSSRGVTGPFPRPPYATGINYCTLQNLPKKRHIVLFWIKCCKLNNYIH